MQERPNHQRRHLSTWLAGFCALGITLMAGLLPRAQADDVDIYLNSNVLPAQAPLTALALDLPLGTSAIICNNPLSNPPTTDCLKLRSLLSVNDILTLGGNPTGTLTGILAGLDPTTLISDLNSALLGALTIATGPLPPITDQVAYFLVLKKIIEQLVNNRLLILLSHANTGSARTVLTPAVGSPTVTPETPCAFADQSSTADATTPRRNTVSCSNGAYVFVGLHNLANPTELLDVVNKLAAALVPTLNATTVPPSFTLPATGIGPAADSPFQAKEIYLELAKYLRGDAIFNGHLGIYDYGDTNPANNLDTSLPALSWDKTAERNNNTQYKEVLKEYPDACTINLISLQVRESSAQDESDSDISTLFPGVDINGDNKLSLAELVTTAGGTGFRYGATDVRKINSYFVIQENLADATSLVNAGANVSTYTDVLGLIGRGTSIAGSVVPVLSVDASVGTVGTSSDRESKTGQGFSAYIPVFRPLADNQPNWPGNIKRLKFALTADGKTQELRGQDGAVAIDPNTGKIKSTVTTFWTDKTKIGGKPGDGYVADLGGAGQRVPGFRFGGGGIPGRSNPSSGNDTRRLFYDSYPSSGTVGPALVALNADNAPTRTELTTAVDATAYTGSVLCGDDATAKAECIAKCEADCATALIPGLCRLACPTATCADNRSCPYTRTADTITKELLLYARGYDVGTQAQPKPKPGGTIPYADPTGPATSTTDPSGRSWMVGAVLHSRPVAINYGKRSGPTSQPDIRVLYGSSDGYLRMVNDDETGTNAGRELWAFMPQSLMRSLKVQRENASGSQLPYGVDGAATVIIRDRKGSSTSKSSADFILSASSSVNDRVWAYFGLRRGNNRSDLAAGKNYYALDITDPDTPKLMWSISPDGLRRAGTVGVVAGTASQFSSLALTFSTPQVGTMMLPQTTDSTVLVAKPVLFFGGGYNGGRNGYNGPRTGKDVKDDNLTTPTVDERVGTNDFTATANKGNALFIVDAETGELVWKAERTAAATHSYNTTTLTFNHPLLADSIASDVTALDTDSDGITDRLYVGDTGGRLWRGDFAGTDHSKWSFIHVASVGRHGTGSGVVSFADDRRIFHAPDYVPIRSDRERKAFDIVIFGTGDRENPLNKDTINWVYAFRDTDIVSGKTTDQITASVGGTVAAVHTSFNDHTDTCSLTTSTDCTDITALVSSSSGWRIRLTRKGEKMTSAPLTLRNATSFTTYVPSDSLCIPQEGAGSLYNISARTSKPLPFVNQVETTRFSALPTPGLAGEIMATMAGNAAGNKLFRPNVTQRSFRSGWAERVGDDEKEVTQ